MHDPGRPACSFPTTQWTQVELAGRQASSRPCPALENLLRRYEPALKSHLLRKGIDPHRVEDLVQGFIADKVLEKNLCSRADRERGHFRNFLRRSLDRYAFNQHRHEEAGIRSAGVLVPLPREQPSGPADPPDAFDIEWARGLLAETIRRMEQYCQKDGRPDIWEVFHVRLLAPIFDGAPTIPYEDFVGRYHLQTPAQAGDLLVTAKRRFRSVLCEVIGEYVQDPADIDQEIADLMDILARAAEG